MRLRSRSNRRSNNWRLWIILGALTLAACGPRANDPLIERDLALETFDAAWRIIHETHFDTTFNGVDWPALREELRPRAEAARTRGDLREVLGDMVGRLNQSHFDLIPAELADTLDPNNSDVSGEVGDVGLDVRLIDDDVVVTRVDPKGAAAAAGVRPGYNLLSIQDKPVSELVAAARERESWASASFRVWNRVIRALAGAPGDVRRIEVLDERDRARSVEISLRPDQSQPVKLGNLPTLFARFASRRERSSEADVDIGVIWFNFWMVPLMPRIDAAVDEFRELDGMVIDLRGNGGGVAVMLSGISGHFLNEKVSLGTMRTRDTELRVVANPRRVAPDGRRVQPFAGPLAVLIDEGTASASEMFAGGLQSVGRARIFGLTSAGAVLPAALDLLPNGDVLYHAFADFTTTSGVQLEGRGVIPDEQVSLSRAGLLAGRDTQLEAALRWIASRKLATTGTEQSN